jgi:DNA-binding transcriptional LysR family regulator
MDAADLKFFEAVARLGGMSRAAAELNTVQSNVTARIRVLEGELGTPLFHRHARGVSLTDAGRRLLPYARQVKQAIADAKKAVADDGEPNGPLTIGSLESTAALHLAPLLSVYAGQNPKVDLVLRTATTVELIKDVLEHRVEGAFVCGPVDHPDLDEDVFFREELVVLTARKVRKLDDQLIRDGMKIVVLNAGCSYRMMLETMLARRGVTNLRQLEFGTLEAIYACVSAGIGITLLPKRLTEKVWRDGRVAVHKLPPAESRVETVFIRRRDAYVSAALDAFLRCARPAALRAAAE